MLFQQTTSIFMQFALDSYESSYSGITKKGKGHWKMNISHTGKYMWILTNNVQGLVIYRVPLLFTGTRQQDFGEVCVYIWSRRHTCVHGLVFPLGFWQKRVPRSQWQRCSRPVCFQNRQGEAVQLGPGTRVKQRPVRPIFLFNKYFLPLLTFTFPSHILEPHNINILGLSTVNQCFCYYCAKTLQIAPLLWFSQC